MKFNYTFEQFNEIAVNSDKLTKEQLKLVADKALTGSLTVQIGLSDIPHTDGKVNWDLQVSFNANSLQLKLQTLNILLFLCKAFIYYPNNEYVELAIKIFDDWYHYQSDTGLSGKNTFLWNDHAVAERTENLIYFLLLLDKEGRLDDNLNKMLIDILDKQSKWLADDNNYFLNCNHGIFEDRALICIALLYENENSKYWLSHAKKRLDEQRKFAFTEEMVHVENSPQYHETVLKLFMQISQFLLNFSDIDGEQMYKGLEESSEFLAWCIKPTGYLAEIGDSDGTVESKPIRNKRFRIFKNAHLNYAVMQGEEGTKPEDNCAIYPKSGYFFSRNSWSTDKFSEAIWFMFKAGYRSRVHKHEDDLSIMLTAKGYDVLIDTGKFGYMIGEPHTDYLHSALGHNTIVVDGKGYSISNERTHLSGILEYDLSEEWKYIRAFNDAYQGVKIDRAIYQHYQGENCCIIVHDEIQSASMHTYAQTFHLSEYINIVKEVNGEIIGEIADTNYLVCIKQLIDLDEQFLYTGMQEDLKYGYRSPLMSQTVDCTSVSFEKSGANVEFVTMILIRAKDEKDVISADIDIENLKVRIDNAKCLLLKRRYRPNLGKIKLKVDDFSGKVIAYNPFFANSEECLWELHDLESGEVLDRQIGEEENICFSMTNYNSIFITVNVLTNFHQIIKGVVGYIKYIESKKTYDIIPIPDNRLNLHVKSLQMEKQSGNIVNCTIIFDYAFKSKIHWHIYRNGGHYDYVFKVNECTLQYHFKEPGNYTVMFYISGINGEQEFWNYPQIDINEDDV